MIYNEKHPGSLQTTRVLFGVDQWENQKKGKYTSDTYNDRISNALSTFK
jgi:hypothetical protein